MGLETARLVAPRLMASGAACGEAVQYLWQLPLGERLKVILFFVFAALTLPGVMKTNACSPCSQPRGHSRDRNFLLGGHNYTCGILRTGFCPGMGPNPGLGTGPGRDTVAVGIGCSMRCRLDPLQLFAAFPLVSAELLPTQLPGTPLRIEKRTNSSPRPGCC